MPISRLPQHKRGQRFDPTIIPVTGLVGTPTVRSGFWTVAGNAVFCQLSVDYETDSVAGGVFRVNLPAPTSRALQEQDAVIGFGVIFANPGSVTVVADTNEDTALVVVSPASSGPGTANFSFSFLEK